MYLTILHKCDKFVFKEIFMYHLQALTFHHKKPRFRIYYSHRGRRYLKDSMTQIALI